MNKTTEHKLINNTLTNENNGVWARCTCGWTSGGRISSMVASALFRDHVKKEEQHVSAP